MVRKIALAVLRTQTPEQNFGRDPGGDQGARPRNVF